MTITKVDGKMTRIWRTQAGTLLVERPAGKMRGYVVDANGAKIEDASTYFELDDAGRIVNCYRASSCPLDDYLYSSAFGVTCGTLYQYSSSEKGPSVESEMKVLLADLVPAAKDQLSEAIRAAIEDRESQFRNEAARPGFSWTWWAVQR